MANASTPPEFIQKHIIRKITDQTKLLVGARGWKTIENLEVRTVKPALKRVKQWPTQASDEDRAMEMGYREALLRLKIESETLYRDEYTPGLGPESDDPLSERKALLTTSHLLERVYDKMFPLRHPVN